MNFRDNTVILVIFIFVRSHTMRLRIQTPRLRIRHRKPLTRNVRPFFANMKPDVAKRMGKAVKLRTDWDITKHQYMREILYAKFTQNPELKEKLLETGEELLVEGNVWHDNEWGICSCYKCRKTKGQNLLGIFLMEIRKSLRQ